MKDGGQESKREGCAVGEFVFLSSGSFFFISPIFPGSRLKFVVSEDIECNLMFKKSLVGNHKQYLPSCFIVYIFCSLLIFCNQLKGTGYRLNHHCGIRQVGKEKICRHLIKKTGCCVTGRKKLFCAPFSAA